METELREQIQSVDDAAEIKPTARDLIERYASIQGISYEEAELQIGAPTEEEILKNNKIFLWIIRFVYF